MKKILASIDRFIEAMAEVLELKARQIHWHATYRHYEVYGEGFRDGIRWERERKEPLDV